RHYTEGVKQLSPGSRTALRRANATYTVHEPHAYSATTPKVLNNSAQGREAHPGLRSPPSHSRYPEWVTQVRGKTDGAAMGQPFRCRRVTRSVKSLFDPRG